MNVSQFKKAISTVEPFLMTEDFIPILQHVWFHPSYLMAFNDVQAIQVAFNSNLHCAVPGKILLKLLGTLKQGDVDINEKDHKLLIGSGKNQTKLPILPPEEFVFMFPEPKGTLVLLEPSIVNGLEKCLQTISHDPTRPERNGVTFKITQDTLQMFVTDGKTVSRFTTEGKFKIPATEELKVILPLFFCDQLCKMIKEQQVNASLFFNENTVIALINDNKIFSRLINAKPPQYENAIAKNYDDSDNTTLFEIPEDLAYALERALLMVYPEKGIVMTQMELTDGQLTLHTESDKGRAHDVIDTRIKHINKVFHTNPNLLQRAVLLCDHVTLTETAWIFTAIDKNFIHLISI